MKVFVKLSPDRWQHILKLLSVGKTAMDVICTEYITDALQTAVAREKTAAAKENPEKV